MIEWLIQALQRTLDKVRLDPSFDRGIEKDFSGPHVHYQAGEFVGPYGGFSA
jgi:hypothetical protein